MSYQPPDLLVSRVTTQTSGVPGSGGVTVVAAPGANLRIRLWGVGATHVDPTVAVPTWYLPWVSGGVTLISQSLTPGFPADSDLFPGGIALDTNTSLSCNRRTSAASRDVDLWAMYTIENTP